MNFKFLCSVAFIVLTINQISFAQQQIWPFRDLNNNNLILRGHITGTPGEIRRGPAPTRFKRFHGGADITSPVADIQNTIAREDRFVYAVDAGQITWNTQAIGSDCWDAIITIGDYQYKHVKIDNQLRMNQMINVGDFIGEMFNVVPQPPNSPPRNGCPIHVHMNETNQTVNYMVGLTPLNDTDSPDFWEFSNSPNWVRGHNNTVSSEVLQFYTNGIDNTHDDTDPNIYRYGATNMPPDVLININGTNIDHTVIFNHVSGFLGVFEYSELGQGT